MSSRSSIARRKTKRRRRRGTDLRKIRRLQFAFLGAAFTIAAAYLVISDKTMSAASPEAADVEVTSALPSSFETSALPRAHEPLLAPKEEVSSDTFEEEQARWVAIFDALVEQHALVERQAKTENSAQDLRSAKRHVRFTPESGHVRCTSLCLLCANSGHQRPDVQQRISLAGPFV